MSSLPAAATAPAGARLVRRRSDVRLVLIFGAAALLLIAVGPYVLPDFMVNNLIRGFLYAAVALTVDILWGYTGILTFGQSAFFGIGAYAAGLDLHAHGLLHRARGARTRRRHPRQRRWSPR